MTDRIQADHPAQIQRVPPPASAWGAVARSCRFPWSLRQRHNSPAWTHGFSRPGMPKGPLSRIKKQKGGPEGRPCLTPPGRDGIVRRACHSQTSTFLTLSWGLLFSICFALPFWPVSVGCGTPLAFLCPRSCGQATMQAAPAIAVQVFALAGRPGPCPGASCLARQGATGTREGLFHIFLKVFLLLTQESTQHLLQIFHVFPVLSLLCIRREVAIRTVSPYFFMGPKCVWPPWCCLYPERCLRSSCPAIPVGADTQGPSHEAGHLDCP